MPQFVSAPESPVGTGDAFEASPQGPPAGGPLAPIVCGVDGRYVRPLGALMASIAAAHPDCLGQLRMIVVHPGLDSGERRQILLRAGRLNLSVDLRQSPPMTARFPVSGWVSDAVYLRLALPDLVPDAPVVLYLDTDTLVVGDLRPLLRQPLHGAALAAVRDPQNPTVGAGIALPGWRHIGVPHGREYFNSGVMLINLREAARAGVFERARQFLTEHPEHVRLWDQDALNVAVEDRWLRLDRRWNTFAMSPLTTLPGFFHHTAEPVMPLADLLADEYAAAVLHFAGPVKPWTADYPAVPLRHLYQRYLTAVSSQEGP
jgi:UDP-D-galactose:(glucosyl)LPS alpha-1,3-D-galactosyltransferase